MAGRVSYYGGITTNGLIMDVDAAKLDSYVRTGTIWSDVSGNRNNGTLTNFGAQSTWNSGNGGAIVFDGTNDYVEFSDVPFRIPNYNFTCEFVFYFTGGSYTNHSVIGKRSSNAPYNQWSFGINNGDPYGGGTGKVLIAFLRDDNNPNSASYDRVLTYTLPSEGIYHVILTNSQAQTQLWVNGAVRSTSTVSFYTGSFNISGFNFRIGNYYTATYWNDKIYLSRFYNRTLTNTEVSQNINAMIFRFVPRVSDSDAQNFLNVTYTTNQTQANAINYLVLGLKSFNLWTKMIALYPFVGGNEYSHKFNLKDPRDLDAAFRLTFYGPWVHSTTGVLPNGSSTYCETYLTPSTSMSINDCGISYYNRTSNAFSNFPNHGIIPTSTNNRFYVSPQSTHSAIIGTESASFWIQYADSDKKGFYSDVRTATNSRTSYKNGVVKGTNTNNDTGGSLPSLTFQFGKANIQFATATYTFDELAIFVLHQGLTDTDAANFYTVVQNYNTILGRQVV